MALSLTSATHLTFTCDDESFEVRYKLINGQPWIVARDLAAPLGKTEQALRMQIQTIPEQWKGVSSIDTLGGPQSMQTINQKATLMLVNKTRCKPGSMVWKFQVWCATALDELLTKGSVSIEPPRPTAITAETRFNLCERLAMRYPDDSVVQTRVKEAMLHIAAPINDAQVTHLKDLTTILIEMGETVPANYLSALGRYICARYEAEYNEQIGQTTKIINGATRTSRVYTETQVQRVIPYINQYLIKKGWKRTKPKLQIKNDIKRYFTDDESED